MIMYNTLLLKLSTRFITTEKKGAPKKSGIQSEAYRLEEGFGRGSDIQRKKENTPRTQQKVTCKQRKS